MTHKCKKVWNRYAKELLPLYTEYQVYLPITGGNFYDAETLNTHCEIWKYVALLYRFIKEFSEKTFYT